MIVGGGNAEGTGIMEKFIELGGGAEKGKFIIVPTAGGNRNRPASSRAYTERARDRRRGSSAASRTSRCCTPHDPKVADTEAFVKDLRERDGGVVRRRPAVEHASTRTRAR